MMILNLMKRGIVVANPVQVIHDSNRSGPYGTVAFHPVFLRRYLLYWDEIHWVTISPANIGITPGLSTLQEEKILWIWYQPMYPLEGEEWDQNYLTSSAQLEVMRNLNREQNGIFVLGQAGPNLFLPESERELSPGIELKLTNALPTFSADIPVEDILNFKEKRRDELKRFQNTLSKFGEKLSGTDNIERATNITIEEINLRLGDLHRVMKERFKGKLLWSSLKAIMRVPLLVTELKNAFTGNHYRLDRVATDLTSLAEIIIGEILTIRNIPEKFNDIAYLYWIEKEINK
ncbi:MAG: DUF6236 family protein [Promethearchaeota archaeon]